VQKTPLDVSFIESKEDRRTVAMERDVAKSIVHAGAGRPLKLNMIPWRAMDREAASSASPGRDTLSVTG